VAGNGTLGFSGDGGSATSAKLTSPTGVAVDSSGNLYITDQGQNGSNCNVRKVSSSGTISTYEGSVYQGGTSCGSFGDGGLATQSAINVPKNLALDSSNNLYIADTYNNAIREVTSSNLNINRIVGNGSQGYAGDGGAPTSAELSLPYAVAVDSTGKLYIADYQNTRIRVVQ